MIKSYIKSNKGNIISGPLLIKKNIYLDTRGKFFESWNSKEYELLLKTNNNFVQDNVSISSKGVLRGLHYQLPPKDQAKLVFCLNGEIFDVFVDLRKNSKTFSEWGSVNLNSIDNQQLWIPSGFAHGFIAKKENTIVQYKTTYFWDKNYERSILWSDTGINIKWPLKELGIKIPLISEKDSLSHTFEKVCENGDIFL